MFKQKSGGVSIHCTVVGPSASSLAHSCLTRPLTTWTSACAAGAPDICAEKRQSCRGGGDGKLTHSKHVADGPVGLDHRKADVLVLEDVHLERGEEGRVEE